MAKLKLRKIKRMLQNVIFAFLCVLSTVSVLAVYIALTFPQSWDCICLLLLISNLIARVTQLQSLQGQTRDTPPIIGELTANKPEKNDDYLITTSYFRNHMDIRWGNENISKDMHQVHFYLVETFRAFSRYLSLPPLCPLFLNHPHPLYFQDFVNKIKFCTGSLMVLSLAGVGIKKYCHGIWI
jgi:hypothetical protein